MKKAELQQYKTVLMGLRARLRGDVTQMTDEALKKSRQEASGDLSNMPIHMADIGTDNFDQEFTLSLIESEQVTLAEVDEALKRIAENTFGLCEECGEPVPKERLKAIPYTRYCVACARKLEDQS